MALRYQEYGDKSAALMLFLHGGGVGGWMWDKQIEYFTHYHCIVPELPEHGLHNDASAFSVRASAEEIIQLIEAKAKGKQVILIGFSLGAQVLIELLSLRPTIIDAAIMNSALVRPNPSVKKWIRPLIGLSFPLIKHRWFSKLQAKSMYIREEDFEKYYAESRCIKQDTLVRVLEENMSFEIPADFRKATGKLLVTVGEKEKAVMKESAKDIVKANSNCTGVVIPEIGHGVSLAKPDFFNLLVEAWVEKGSLPPECKTII